MIKVKTALCSWPHCQQRGRTWDNGACFCYPHSPQFKIYKRALMAQMMAEYRRRAALYPEMLAVLKVVMEYFIEYDIHTKTISGASLRLNNIIAKCDNEGKGNIV